MAHNHDRRMLLAGLGAAGALALTRKAQAAQLAPSGPTIRDLSNQICKPQGQAEARIPIVSLPSSATSMFVISAPGVYVLTGPITGIPGLSFLEIAANEVEVHLDDWPVLGGAGVRAGILTPSSQSNVYIYDAAFRDWPDTCINLQNSSNCLVETSCFTNCDGNGSSGTSPGIVALGDRSYIWDCDAFTCLGSLMSIGAQGAIEECSNADGVGGCFACGDGSVIENCFAMHNAGTGVRLGTRSTLTLSRLLDNDGVTAPAQCVIFDCEITGCPVGVSVTGPGVEIEDNYFSTCPTAIEVGAGGGGSLIDLNHIVGSSATGIYVDGAAPRCLVTRNQVGGGPPGSVAYSIGASSSFGTIHNVTGGGNINATATGPVQTMDNIEY